MRKALERALSFTQVEGSHLKRLLLVPAVVAALLGAAFIASGAAPAAAEDSTITIKAGEGEPGYAINAFLPQNISVLTGTTVRWIMPWLEPHIIAGCVGQPPAEEPAGPIGGDFPNAEGCFFNPFTVGDPANPPSFEVRFVEAGTYNYFCPIHPAMTAQVKVFDEGEAGSLGVDNQQSADARGAAELNTRLINIQDVAAGVAAQGVTVANKAGGGKNYGLAVGASSLYGDSAQQFIPATVNVKVGDSVTWTNSSEEPHNILFGGPPANADPFDFPGDPSGSKFDGTGRVQSPMTFGGDPQAPHSFEVVFTKEGTYHYICMLHADQGMVGTVVVGASGAPGAPGAPNTGTGLASEGGATGLAGWLLVAGALALCASLGAGVALRVRREE